MTYLTSFLRSKLILLIVAIFAYSGCTTSRPVAGSGGDAHAPSMRPFPVRKESRIAVMPVENLSGNPALLNQIRDSIIALLKAREIAVIDKDRMEEFMERHRIRYSGGISRELGNSFLGELGVDAVLVISLDLYDEAVHPKIAFTSRLVSTRERTAILWADSVAMAGNDSPGFLGIGMVDDPRVLRSKALGRIMESLTEYLSEREPWAKSYVSEFYHPSSLIPKKFRPKEAHQSDPMQVTRRRPRILAVLPFLNESGRRYAGEIMALHFVQQFAELGGNEIEVLEPGVVRQGLLMSRTIMEGGGLSLPQSDLLHDMLDVDLVLTGNVTEYQDYSGPLGAPKVDFSTRLIDAKRRQVVWTSISQAKGDQGVFFFNAGKVNTAHHMATFMARAVAARIIENSETAKFIAPGRVRNSR